MDEPVNQPAAEPSDDKSSDQVKPKGQEPAAQWEFKQNDSDDAATAPSQSATKHVEPLSWTASEFIHHQKTAGWYVMLGLAGIILAAVVFLLTRDMISTGVIIFAALIFGFYAGHKPRTLNYKLDDSGLTIGEKFYSYASFKSFAVAEEGAFSSIVLMPLKRFMPSLSLYYEPKDETKITDILALRLPVETHKRDAVDSLMHRIRF
jgi:hypothetical protein